LKRGGLNNLHVLSDFDRTLTYGAIGGIKTPSIISMLRDGKHLTDEYAAAAHALFEKYHPIEVDPSISLAEKKVAMAEWWRAHNELLVQSGLTKTDLEDIVANGHVRFRAGVPEFLDFLHENEIPLVIISASGCGDVVRMMFQSIGKDYPNIHFVTNQFECDAAGRVLAAKEPVIHSMNKDETVLAELPEVFAAIKDRKNVILLGDSLGDLGMIEGFDFESLLKIGFLNFDFDAQREIFKQNFDVVLEGDGDFEFVNELVENL
jgi:5'-nucleotidase